MERKFISVAALTNDDDGVSVAQSKGAAGALTFGGALVSSGVATFAAAQKLTATSSGNDSGITITFTGTNADGVAISETITCGNTTTAKSTKYFKTVTTAPTVSGATAGTIKVGVVAADGFVSEALEVDINQYGDDFKYLLGLAIGAGTFSVEGTTDLKSDTWTESVQEEGNWVAFTGLSGVTSDTQILAPIPSKTVRVKCTAWTSGATKLSVLVRGPRK